MRFLSILVLMMISEFPHHPPEGYYYEQSQFQKNIIGIWIGYDRTFVYNNGDPVLCIWGFYNTKTKQYHSPINSSKVGDIVRIEDTTPYSAMVVKRTPLERAFLG